MDGFALGIATGIPIGAVLFMLLILGLDRIYQEGKEEGRKEALHD